MFRRTYDEILELIKTTALDAGMARKIVRKGGLRGGAGAGNDGDGSELTEELSSPLPPDRHPHRPRRYVDNSLAWPYHASPIDGDVTYWDGRYVIGSTITGDTTMFGNALGHQTRWTGMWFPGWTETSRPPLGTYLLPPGTSTAPLQRTDARCWVGGQTLYDPFPHDGFYLWKDMRDVIDVQAWTSVVLVGKGPSPIENIAGGGSGEDSAGAVGPIILRLYASLDQGATWVAPYHPVAVTGGTNTGAQYGAINLNPEYSPTPTEDGFNVGSVVMREEIREDDVLFKFTLTSADADNWVEYESLGIMG